LKKLKKHLQDNITAHSNLELNDVKKHINFSKTKREFNWNWKRTLTFAPMMILLIVAIGMFSDNIFVPVQTLNSVVTLDINPGVMIELDEDNNVMSIEALNADAETLLQYVDLTLTNLDELVVSIIEAAESLDFLLEDDTILFSVQSDDPNLNDELETDLEDTVSKEALKLGKKLEAVVQKYKEILDTKTSIVSQAKASLIEALIITGDYTMDDIDELAGMKVNKIKELLEESYGITIKDIVAESNGDNNDNDENQGQTKKRERYVVEILELELLTLEEVAILETSELKEVLKDYYEIAEDQVKESAEKEVESTDRRKYVETLSGLVELTNEQLEALNLDDLEDLLEDYYDSIDGDDDAKEKVKNRAKEAKEKAESEKEKFFDAEDDAEEIAEELLNEMIEVGLFYGSGITALTTQLETERDNMTEDEIADLEEEIQELKNDLEENLLELKEEADELISEVLEDAMEDKDEAEKKAREIAEKARNEYQKEEVKNISSVEEAEGLLSKITEEHETMMNELNLRLATNGLTDDEIEDLEEEVADLTEDFEDLVEDIEDEIKDLNEDSKEDDETEDDEKDEDDEEDEDDEDDEDEDEKGKGNSGGN